MGRTCSETGYTLCFSHQRRWIIFLSDSFWKRVQRGPAEGGARRIRGQQDEGIERWLGTGFSESEKSYLAGVEATRQALEKIGSKKPNLALVLIAGDYEYKTVLSGVEQLVEAPIVGSEAPGGMFNEDTIAGRGVMVALFAFSDNSFALGIGGGFVSSTDKAIASALGDISDAHKKALEDGKTHAGLYLIAPGSYPLVGEALFNELKPLSDEFEVIAAGVLGQVSEPSFVSMFWDGDTYSDHIVALAIFSKTPLVAGLGHGFHPICPLRITKAKGNLIKEMDNQPVDWAMREILEKRGVKIDELSNPKYAAEVLPRYQLALAKPDMPGKFRAFLPLALEKGGLLTNAVVEEGSTVWFMEASDQEMMESVDRSTRDAVIRTRGERVIGAMAFESVIRLHILAEKYQQESDILRRHLGVPFFGLGTIEEVVIADGVFSAAHSGSLSLQVFTTPSSEESEE